MVTSTTEARTAKAAAKEMALAATENAAVLMEEFKAAIYPDTFEAWTRFASERERMGRLWQEWMEM